MKGYMAIGFAIFLLGTNAKADETRFVDGEGRFTVTVPAGWQVVVPEQKSLLALVMASPRAKSGGICTVMVDPTPSTKDMEADLDEAFSQVNWKESLAAGGLKDAVVQDSGQKVQRGRKTYFVVATATVKDEAMTGKQVTHVVPGSLYFVQCNAAKAAHPAMAPTFEKVFASFEAFAPFKNPAELLYR